MLGQIGGYFKRKKRYIKQIIIINNVNKWYKVTLGKSCKIATTLYGHPKLYIRLMYLKYRIAMRSKVMIDSVSGPGSTVSIVTLIYSAVTVLTVIVTVADSRPTSETVTVGVPLDSNNDSMTEPVCIDLCQKCFNSSGTHQETDDDSNELPGLIIMPEEEHPNTNTLKDNQRYQEVEKSAEPVLSTTQRQEEGYLTFSPEGHRRRQEVKSSPCMGQFKGHVTSLEQELLRLDTRVQHIMGRLGLSSVDAASSATSTTSPIQET